MPIISVQLFSVREALAQDLAGTLARIASLGLTNVEPYAFDHDPQRLRQALVDCGLQAPSGHAAVIDAPDPERIFEAALLLEMTTVINPYIGEERWQTHDQVTWLQRRIDELATLAASFGLEFGYHNHDWELRQRIDDRHAFDLLTETVDPSVVFEIDPYWSTIGGADTVDLLTRLGNRVRAIHIKDGILDGDVSKQSPAGRGELDLPAILTAAPQAMRVIEFDSYAGDMFAGIAESLAWLNDYDQTSIR